jgi:hypothetical protein
VLRFNASAIREDCGRLARSAAELAGSASGGAASGGSGGMAAGGDRGPVPGSGLPGLKSFSIRPADIPEIARRSSGSSMSGNPVDVPQSVRERLLAELL